jgi:hypothetical protein
VRHTHTVKGVIREPYFPPSFSDDGKRRFDAR